MDSGQCPPGSNPDTRHAPYQTCGPSKAIGQRPQRRLAALCGQLVQSLPQRRLRRQSLDPERMCENRVFSVEARICEVGAGVAEYARQAQQNVTVADCIAAANLEVLRQVLSRWFP